MSMLKRAAQAAAIVLIAGCTGDAGKVLGPSGGPSQTISDAAHAGAVPGFYFLPPMVTAPSFSGTFDPALSPRVEICELSGTSCGAVIATFTTTSGSGSEVVRVEAAQQHYIVNWKTGLFNLDPAKHYRIGVYVGTFQLGFADVDVVGSGRELKNVDTDEYIPLLDDRTLPIKFRIETGIVGQVVVSPAADTVNVGQTAQFTAALIDLHGNPVTGPTVTWSSSDTNVATIDGTGLATGVAPGTVTITASIGYVSGTASLTVEQPNQPPVAFPDTFQAIGNVTVPVAAPGVLANDTDPDANTLSAVAGTYPTAQGGTFTLAADGSFTYLSAAGFIGVDSVAYTVTDGIATASSTVTFDVPSRVWYADNSAAAPGDGRDATPFAALADAEAASAAGETIFVLYGDGTTGGYDAGVTLKNGQALTGQGVGANVEVTLNGQSVVLLAAGSAPTITRAAAGATIQLASNNTVQGLAVESTSGAGIAGSGFGVFAAGAVSVAAAGGPALDLANGAAAASFTLLSSTNSAGAGLELANLAGSIAAPAGSITGAAGAGVLVTGGSGVIVYGGSISGSGARAVDVSGRTGGVVTLSGDITDSALGIRVQNNTGGTIAFTGASKALSTGANPAVTLASNTGATIQFAGGGLAIATTSGTGFTATGGGTLTVTGANNAIGSTAGTALVVQNTTVGAAGLSFRSISASGAVNGIVLDNTGAGGVQVTGTGSAGSGGTIQNMSGDGVLLSNAANVSLASMAIQDNGSDGVRVEALGAANAGVSVAGSIFSANRGDHFQASAGGSAVLDVTFTGNVLSGGHPSSVGQGILIGATGPVPGFTGSVSYDVVDNTINGAITSAITIDMGISAAGAVFSGRVRDNVIGTAGVALSCSAQGSGIVVDARGNGTHTASVTGNTVRRCLDRGISSTANDGAGTLNLTVTGNAVSELVSASSREGFFLNAGSTSTNVFGGVDSHSVCLALTGNSLVHGPSATTDVRLRQRFGTTVRLPGYAGANTDVAAVQAFVSGNNSGASVLANVAVPPGGGFVGGAACPQP